jgi:hypothetical protein
LPGGYISVGGPIFTAASKRHIFPCETCLNRVTMIEYIMYSVHKVSAENFFPGDQYAVLLQPSTMSGFEPGHFSVLGQHACAATGTHETFFEKKICFHFYACISLQKISEKQSY